MLKKILIITTLCMLAFSAFALKENPGTIMFLQLDQEDEATEGKLYFMEYDGKYLIEKDPPGEIKLTDEALELFNKGQDKEFRQEVTTIVQERLRKIIEEDSTFIVQLVESKNEDFMDLGNIPLSLTLGGTQFISEKNKVIVTAPSKDWQLIVDGLQPGAIAKFKIEDAISGKQVAIDISVFDLSNFKLASSVYDVAQLELAQLKSRYDILSEETKEGKNAMNVKYIDKSMEILRKNSPAGTPSTKVKKAYYYINGQGIILTMLASDKSGMDQYASDYAQFVDNVQEKN